MRRVVIVLSLAAILLMTTAGCLGRGDVSITVDELGAGCRVELSNWSGQEACELFLQENDRIRVQIVRERGDTALSITAASGRQVYTGNGLNTNTFVVTIRETGTYTIAVKGRGATGSIEIERL